MLGALQAHVVHGIAWPGGCRLLPQLAALLLQLLALNNAQAY